MEKNFKLTSKYSPAGDQPEAILKLTEGLNSGIDKQILLGVTGSGKTYTVANIIQNTQRPTIIMAHNKTLAAQLYGEMKEFFPHNSVEYFVSYYDYYQPEAYVPSSDSFIQKDASINQHIQQMRMSATKALLDRKDVIIIATVSAIYGIGDPKSYLKMLLHLTTGEIINQRDILKTLSNMQYSRNDTVMERGNFRVKGEIIDIFPADSERNALRIELFDDEIEQLSWFDPLTGAIDKKVSRVTIYPKTHYVTPRETILKAIDSIKQELKERLEELRSNKKLVEAQRLEERTKYDIEMMVELGYCSGIENYSRYLSSSKPGEPPPTLMSYLPKNALMIIDESHVTVSQIGSMYKGDKSRKTTLIEYGFRLPSALDNRPLKFDEFSNLSPQTIYVSATPGKYELQIAPDEIVEQVIRPTGLLDPVLEIRSAITQVDDLLSEISIVIKKQERILVTTLTKKMAEDLTDYLSEHKVKVRYLHSDIDTVERVEIIRDLRVGKFDVLVGINLLREGLDMPEVSLVAILDADKEGFLRSASSLIQTIGRAARNLNGRAILYAEQTTKSMQKAIEETDRRRKIQMQHNIDNNITPQPITRSNNDILDTETQLNKNSDYFDNSVSETISKYNIKSEKDIFVNINALEKQMLQHARDLEFEQAAKIRNQIDKIKETIKHLD